jgi:hypothetical protein
MYEVTFVRNGAKAYVKKSTSFSQRKIRETWFYEILYIITPSQQVVACGRSAGLV